MSMKRDDAILQGLAEYWKSAELQDFTVTVGNVNFGCHRLVLASCSDFFKGLFRSNMQETAQKCVNIHEIASETFELILERIYTGHAVLTDDNVIDMWRAAHQLQIHFLVLECENFVLNTLSMEKIVEYFHIGNTFNSTYVIDGLWTFVAKNCYSFFETSYFLEMDMAGVLLLVKSQELEIKSEDDVILAILKWAEFQGKYVPCSKENEDSGEFLGNKDISEVEEIGDGYSPCREKIKQCTGCSTTSGGEPDTLFQRDAYEKRDNQGNVAINDISILLSNARTYLVSKECLKMLIGHPLVRDNKKAIIIVKDALLYQLNCLQCHGYWPSKAVHRNNSNVLNCIVTAVKRQRRTLFCAYSVVRQKWYPISYSVKYIETMNVFVVNNIVHALGISSRDEADITLLLWQLMDDINNGTLFNIRSDNLCLAVVNPFVYFFSAQEQTVSRMYVRRHTISAWSKLQGPEPIAHLMVFEEKILVFHASTDETVNQTMVRCYDTSRNSWTKQKNIEGPAIGMTSFRDDNFTYLLQSNGNLWKVIKPKGKHIDFEIVAKLWSINVSLHGGVIYLGDLYIGLQPNGRLPNDQQLPRSWPGLFRSIIYLKISSDEKAAFFPMLLSENDFYQDQLPPYITDLFTDLL